MNVGKTFKAIGNFISKNSPIITATAAVGGLITTVVLACKATPKYLLDIDNAIAEKGEELTRGEKAKIFVKAYGATIVAGVATTGAIVASPLLMKKNCDKVLTGALAAYTVAENKLEKLNNAIKEELPKKEQDKVKVKILSVDDKGKIALSVKQAQDKNKYILDMEREAARLEQKKNTAQM